MSTDDVYIFEIAPEDFDAGLLPESARQPGSPELKDEVGSPSTKPEALTGWHEDISIKKARQYSIMESQMYNKANMPVREIIKKLQGMGSVQGR